MTSKNKINTNNTTYIIEDNIDFYKELNKSLENNDNHIEDENNICLITSEPLEEKYITLECNHKFNYFPFVNAITLDMKNYSYNSFFCYELKCPYCRKIHYGRPIPYDYRYSIYLPFIHPPYEEIKYNRKEMKRAEKEAIKLLKKTEMETKRAAAKLAKLEEKTAKPKKEKSIKN